MIHHPSFPRPWLPLISALTMLAVVAAGGCSRNKFSYGLDPISSNVAPAPGWLADPKAPLGAGEKEVLARRGRPDFIRYWWKPDGRPVNSSDFYGRKDQLKDMIKRVKKSWIYQDKGEEVVFMRDGAAYSVHPLDDLAKLLCQYGDPSNRSNPVTIDGQVHETWIWIDHGIQAELVDGHTAAVKNFQGTGAGTYILK